MSYEPHEWVAGETVTPSKLNNIEQGIANGGGALLVETTINNDETYTCNKTFQEIYDAMNEGKVVYIYENNTIQIVFYIDSGDYYFETRNGIFSASSSSDYPTLQDGK